MKKRIYEKNCHDIIDIAYLKDHTIHDVKFRIYEKMYVGKKHD